VYDVGQGEGPNNANVNYHEIEPFLLSSNHDVNPPDDVDYV
jgi:predicted type IV restriction endonuclease